MNPIYDFKGQVALVTGAAKGMGLATARMFAESGASVVLADIDDDLAAKEAKRIVLEGDTAIGVARYQRPAATSSRSSGARQR
jgi:NAD(P)-dependent dehydrogenase (short-subunit alcohol dehydrogenase family)